MSTSFTTLTIHRPSLALLLLTAAGCHHDNPAPAPTKTALLTAPSWHTVDSRLTINGVEGVRLPSGVDDITVKFEAGGSFTTALQGIGPNGTGSWVFANNETQLVTTSTGGNPTEPQQIYTLTSTDLSLGYSFTQVQVQQALASSNPEANPTDYVIRNLLGVSAAFTFPNNTPPVSDFPQITSLVYKRNFRAQ